MQTTAPTFTKLALPKFQTWLIHKADPVTITELTPVPVSLTTMKQDLGNPEEQKWTDLRAMVDAAKDKLIEIPKNKFHELTSPLDMYFELKKTAQTKLNMLHASNGALKIYEIITQLQLLKSAEETCLPEVNVFCNAELPGAMSIAINHYMRTVCPTTAFDWIASSYVVMDEHSTLLQDDYGLVKMNPTHWLIQLNDPSPDMNGDVTVAKNLRIMQKKVHERFKDSGGAHLYTSDAGIKVEHESLNQQEEFTADINFGQILSGLLTLTVGGSLVTKQFTFTTPFSRSVIALVATLFNETYIVKPVTSRPANSEIYLVGKGFLGLKEDLANALLERLDAYKRLLTTSAKATYWGSLLNRNMLLQSDNSLFKAATAVYEKQQIPYLNEVFHFFKLYQTNPQLFRTVKDDKLRTEKVRAQAQWLQENPMFRNERNLPSETITKKNRLKNALPTPAQAPAKEVYVIKKKKTARDRRNAAAAAAANAAENGVFTSKFVNIFQYYQTLVSELEHIKTVLIRIKLDFLYGFMNDEAAVVQKFNDIKIDLAHTQAKLFQVQERIAQVVVHDSDEEMVQLTNKISNDIEVLKSSSQSTSSSSQSSSSSSTSSSANRDEIIADACKILRTQAIELQNKMYKYTAVEYVGFIGKKGIKNGTDAAISGPPATSNASQTTPSGTIDAADITLETDVLKLVQLPYTFADLEIKLL